MRMVLVVLWSVLILSANTSCVASTGSGGGGMDGGGVDHHSLFAGTAWFVGTTPVRYCYRLSSQFGATQEEVTAAMTQAFGKWSAYLKNSYDATGYTYNPDFIPSLRFEFAGRCRGGEDLEFLFGVNTSDSRKERGRYENPVAFTHEIERVNNRGRGFIWLAPAHSVDQRMHFPDWKKGNNLLGITMHEIGHVFGIKHFPGTIMRESFEREMQTNFLPTPEQEERAAKALSSIDDTHFLISPYSFPRAMEYPGRLGYESAGSTAQDVFYRLTDRAPSGAPRMWVTQEQGRGFTFHLSDAADSFEIPFQLQYSTGTDMTFVIFTARKRGDFTEQSGMLSHFGYSFFGRIHTPKGEDWDISLDWNRVQQGEDSVLVAKKLNDSYPFFLADPVSGKY